MMTFLKVILGLIIAWSLFDLFFLPEYTYEDVVKNRMKAEMLLKSSEK